MSHPSDIAFTPSVKNIQSRKGSREHYENVAPGINFHTRITEDLEAFIAGQDSAFLATVNADGQPYIQHRGGPPGFIKVMDRQTLAFADYLGNRQFISQGNLIDNEKCFLFLMDYTQRARIKVWGTAKVIEDDKDLLDSLMPERSVYRAIPEQVLQIRVSLWDGNCPQYIPQRLDAGIVQRVLREKDEEIANLRLQIESLRSKE